MFFYHQRRFTETKTIKSFREGRAWYRIQSSLNSYVVGSKLAAADDKIAIMCDLFMAFPRP